MPQEQFFLLAAFVISRRISKAFLRRTTSLIIPKCQGLCLVQNMTFNVLISYAARTDFTPSVCSCVYGAYCDVFLARIFVYACMHQCLYVVDTSAWLCMCTHFLVLTWMRVLVHHALRDATAQRCGVLRSSVSQCGVHVHILYSFDSLRSWINHDQEVIWISAPDIPNKFSKFW